jgi:hypothetical protein
MQGVSNPPLSRDTRYFKNVQIKNKNRFCCEKQVDGDLNYTILESYICFKYGLINNMSETWLIYNFDRK